MYVIWSHEHSAWWAPGERGYKWSLANAGVYSRDDAIRICSGATLDWSKPPNEVPVRIDDLPASAKALLKT